MRCNNIDFVSFTSNIIVNTSVIDWLIGLQKARIPKPKVDYWLVVWQVRDLQGIPKTEKELKAEKGKVWAALFLFDLSILSSTIGFLVTESLEEAHFDLETEDNHLLENIKEKQLLVTFETFYQTDLDKNKDKEKGGSRRLLVNT